MNPESRSGESHRVNPVWLICYARWLQKPVAACISNNDLQTVYRETSTFLKAWITTDSVKWRRHSDLFYTDTSLTRTLRFVPSVFVLERFDCTSQRRPFLFCVNLQVYCLMKKGQGWTLIAQVSNADYKHWCYRWWWLYKNEVNERKAFNPSENKDTISPAFWLVSGNELMITRSDDPYVALLQTTDDCLGGQTLRNKVYTGHGQKDFKYIKCTKSACKVTYGGMYKATQGFAQANSSECSQIGFLCYNKYYNAHQIDPNMAIMMIGAGEADRCSEADHGIGIKRGITPSNYYTWHMDFGDKANRWPTRKYSLNLWLRWSF